MQIDILTLFPEIALAPLSESIISRARKAGIVEIRALFPENALAARPASHGREHAQAFCFACAGVINSPSLFPREA